jgi:hypothetical protein
MPVFDAVTQSVADAYFNAPIPNTFGNTLGMLLREDPNAQRYAKEVIRETLEEQVGYLEGLGNADLSALSAKLRSAIYDKIGNLYTDFLQDQQRRLGIDLFHFMNATEVYNAIYNALRPYKEEVRGSPLIDMFMVDSIYTGFETIAYHIVTSMWNTDVSSGHGLIFGTLLDESSLAKPFLIDVFSEYLTSNYGSLKRFGEEADPQSVARGLISILNYWAGQNPAYNFYARFDSYKGRYGLTTSLHTEINTTIENNAINTIAGIQDQIQQALAPQWSGPIATIDPHQGRFEVVEPTTPGFVAVGPPTEEPEEEPVTGGVSIGIGTGTGPATQIGAGGIGVGDEPAPDEGPPPGMFPPEDGYDIPGYDIPPPPPPPPEKKLPVAMIASIGLGVVAIVILLKK